MELCDLFDKELKIAVLKKFIEVWEKLKRQFNKISKKLQWSKWDFDKEIEIMKKNQTNFGGKELNK